MATELRVLAADHDPKRRPLPALMDKYQFAYEFPKTDDWPDVPGLPAPRNLNDLMESIAVFLEGRTYRQLVLALAQQTGSSHEDSSVDTAIMLLREHIVGGVPSRIGGLPNLASGVLHVEFAFLEYLQSNHGYASRRFEKAGD